MKISVRELQYLNAPPFSVSRYAGIFTSARDVQSWNAKEEILVMLLGSVIFSSAVQFLKALSPMVVTLAGISTSFRPDACQNA